jgi:hypothetical protein
MWKETWYGGDDLSLTAEINDIIVVWNGKEEFEFYVDSNAEPELMEYHGIKSPEHALEEAKLFIEEFKLVSGVWDTIELDDLPEGSLARQVHEYNYGEAA